MAITRIDRVRSREISEQQDLQQAQRRLNLFNANTFERVHSLRFRDGSSIAIPSMSEKDRQTAGALFAQVPIEQRGALQASADALAGAIHNEAQTNLEGINVGSFSAGLVNQLGQTVETFVLTTGKKQADDAVQAVMYGALVGVEQNLGNFAQDLQDKLNLAGEMRTDISELRDELADWPDDDSTRTFSWTEVTYDENGNMTVTKHEEDLSKQEAQDLMEKLDGQLQTLGDMTEMQKFDLQKMTEDYQQALNTLSALLKAQHESLMAIIRNVKAS